MDEEENLLEAQRAELELKRALSIILDENAYSRLMNVRYSNPQLYLRVANGLLAYYQKIRRRITEEELIRILNININISKQPETKIHIRRK